MASASLELVRSIYADWQRGDFSSAEWADPDIEFERADESGQLRWHGLRGLAEGWADFLSAWDNFRAEVDEYQELADGRILVLSRFRGRGKTSGVELGRTSQVGASLFEITAGKVTRLILYTDREFALAETAADRR